MSNVFGSRPSPPSQPAQPKSPAPKLPARKEDEKKKASARGARGIGGAKRPTILNTGGSQGLGSDDARTKKKTLLGQ